MLCFINVLKGVGKDEQRLKSIKIVYNVNKGGLFTIEYWLNIEDFSLWLDLYESHKENLYENFLYNINNELIENPIDNEKYVYYRLESNDENLHTWIDYIPFLEKDGVNNLEESLKINTNKLWSYK